MLFGLARQSTAEAAAARRRRRRRRRRQRRIVFHPLHPSIRPLHFVTLRR